METTSGQSQKPSVVSSPSNHHQNNNINNTSLPVSQAPSSSPSPITVPPPPPLPPSHSSSVTSSPSISRADHREISPQGRYIKLEEKLGSGAYKDVWRAYDTNNGIEVAWNVVKLNRIPPSERKRIKTEVKLLKDIEHKNVIRYYNSWVDREKEQIIFVTEMMSSGSLKEYLRKNTMIRWSAVKRWCRQILTGLEFLHANQIIHRDIKCDNVFINGSTGDLRIGDLGLSTRITEERGALTSNGSLEHRQMTTVTLTCLGTPEFMAPEMYEENYNEKVDIYAFGMCVLEMVTGLTPYHRCTSAAQVYRKVMNGELPPELEIVTATNPQASDFIKLCLQKHDNRPTASDLLQLPFLAHANPQDDAKEVRNKLHSKFFTQEMAIHEGEEDEVEDEEDDDDDGGEKVDELKGVRIGENDVGGRTTPMVEESSSAKDKNSFSTHPSTVASSPSDNHHISSPSQTVPRVRDDKLHVPFSLNSNETSAGGSQGSSNPSRVRTVLLSSEKDTVVDCCGDRDSHTTTSGSQVMIGDSRGDVVSNIHRLGESADVTNAEMPLMSPRTVKTLATTNVNDIIESSNEQSRKLSDFNLEVAQSRQRTEETQGKGDEDCHHSILILDVIDHTEKANTIVIKCKLLNMEVQQLHQRANNSNSMDMLKQEKDEEKEEKENEKEKKVHLAIDFDYDLVHDSSLIDIVEEMCELEEFRRLPKRLTKVEKSQLIQFFQPIINAAKTVLMEDMQPNQSDGSRMTSIALADRALYRLIVGCSLNSDGYNQKSTEEEVNVVSVITAIEAFTRECPGYFCLASKLLTWIQKSQDDRKQKFQEQPQPQKQKNIEENTILNQIPLIDESISSMRTTVETSISTTDNIPINRESDRKECSSEITNAMTAEQSEEEKFEAMLVCDPEYQELLRLQMTAIAKAERECANKLYSIQQQREKTEKSIQHEIEQLMQRQVDLDKQMDIMQLKFKERMAEFSARKNQALEERLEKQKQF